MHDFHAFMEKIVDFWLFLPFWRKICLTIGTSKAYRGRRMKYSICLVFALAILFFSPLRGQEEEEIGIAPFFSLVLAPSLHVGADTGLPGKSFLTPIVALGGSVGLEEEGRGIGFDFSLGFEDVVFEGEPLFDEYGYPARPDFGADEIQTTYYLGRVQKDFNLGESWDVYMRGGLGLGRVRLKTVVESVSYRTIETGPGYHTLAVSDFEEFNESSIVGVREFGFGLIYELSNKEEISIGYRYFQSGPTSLGEEDAEGYVPVRLDGFPRHSVEFIFKKIY